MPKPEETPKKETRKQPKPDAAAPAGDKPKTKRVDKPTGGGDAPPADVEKPKTKRVSNERAAASAVAKDGAPALAPEGESKTKTGKKPRPTGEGDAPEGDAPAEGAKKGDAGKKKRAAGGDRPKPAGPPPATRGPIDYLLAILGPVVGAAGGVYAFLLLSKGIAWAGSPVVSFESPDAVAKGLGIDLMTSFPWAGIVVGVVVGLLVTLESLKMAPGTATRIMSFLTLLLTCCAVMPFILSGQKMQAFVLDDLGKQFKVPRGGSPDVRALELKLSPQEWDVRQLRAIVKADLDDGDIPVAWIANLKEPVAPVDPKLADKVPETEKAIKSLALRGALSLARSLQEKAKSDVDPIMQKLEPLRDKAGACAAGKGEDADQKATADLEDLLGKFDGRLRKDLSDAKKKPKGAGDWFTGFTIRRAIYGEEQSVNGDIPFDRKVYLGKAIHALVKELPAEMRYAGVLQVPVADDYVGKTDAEKLITKYNFVFVAYDIEKPDRDPVFLPHVTGILEEIKFKIEVLGEK